MIIELGPKFPKRNRKQRQQTAVYRVASLSRDEPQSKLIDGVECAIEGELGEYTIISVPPSVTHQSAQILREAAQKAFNKPVFMVTHNVAFMRVTKMPAKEAAALLKEVEDHLEERAEAEAKAAMEAAQAQEAAEAAAPEAAPESTPSAEEPTP